jgi:phosphatidylserine synthase
MLWTLASNTALLDGVIPHSPQGLDSLIHFVIVAMIVIIIASVLMISNIPRMSIVSLKTIEKKELFCIFFVTITFASIY